MIKIGINGFGRISRILIKQIIEDKKLELLAINYYNVNLETMKYLLLYDTNYPKWNKTIKIDKEKNIMIIDDNIIEIYDNKDIRDIKWKKEITNVIDTTGIYKTNKELK